MADGTDRLAQSHAELLELLREARRDTMNERDSLYDASTNTQGEYTDEDDEREVNELDDFLARMDEAITTAEDIE